MRIVRATGQALLFDVAPRFKLGSNALARNAYGAAASETGETRLAAEIERQISTLRKTKGYKE